jgi:hypothetical protein
MLTGCIGGNNVIDEHQALTELAVKAAVSRVLAEKPAWIDKTYDISKGALILMGDPPAIVDLNELEDYAVNEIEWEELTPEEEVLIRALITAVRQEIELYVSKKDISLEEEKLIYVAQVMLWINQTADIYQQQRS